MATHSQLQTNISLRAVASHLLVGVLTTLLVVLKIKHIKCSAVPTRPPLRVHLMGKLKI